MVTTLREGKAKLSELVERASKGEDVLITVPGKVKARLTRAEALSPAVAGPAWDRELRALQKSVVSRRKPRLAIEEIVSQGREDR